MAYQSEKSNLVRLHTVNQSTFLQSLSHPILISILKTPTDFPIDFLKLGYFLEFSGSILCWTQISKSLQQYLRSWILMGKRQKIINMSDLWDKGLSTFNKHLVLLLTKLVID